MAVPKSTVTSASDAGTTSAGVSPDILVATVRVVAAVRMIWNSRKNAVPAGDPKLDESYASTPCTYPRIRFPVPASGVCIDTTAFRLTAVAFQKFGEKSRLIRSVSAVPTFECAATPPNAEPPTAANSPEPPIGTPTGPAKLDEEADTGEIRVERDLAMGPYYPHPPNSPSAPPSPFPALPPQTPPFRMSPH